MSALNGKDHMDVDLGVVVGHVLCVAPNGARFVGNPLCYKHIAPPGLTGVVFFLKLPSLFTMQAGAALFCEVWLR